MTGVQTCALPISRLLIEYDNVQDGVNHVHAVWRDPGGDFGQSTAGE